MEDNQRIKKPAVRRCRICLIHVLYAAIYPIGITNNKKQGIKILEEL